MAATIDDTLESFSAFVQDKLADGRRMSPEMALALWRERLREARAIQEGMDALNRGETHPVDEFLKELDAEFGLVAE